MAMQDREPKKRGLARIRSANPWDVAGFIVGASVLLGTGVTVNEVLKPIPPKVLLYDGQSTTCGPEWNLRLSSELSSDKIGQLTVMHQLSVKADRLWATDVKILGIDTSGPQPVIYTGVGGNPGVGQITPPDNDPNFHPENGDLPAWLKTQSITGVEFAFTVTSEEAAGLKADDRVSAIFDFTTHPGASAAEVRKAAGNLAMYRALVGNATGGCNNAVVFNASFFQRSSR
jgi:hypothetical protein